MSPRNFDIVLLSLSLNIFFNDIMFFRCFFRLFSNFLQFKSMCFTVSMVLHSQHMGQQGFFQNGLLGFKYCKAWEVWNAECVDSVDNKHYQLDVIQNRIDSVG